MNPSIANYLSKLEFGELQTFKNMGIIPLFTVVENGPEYVSLKEAMDGKLITVTEVDQAGSVPQLKVINTSSLSILLLDGEELAGAKQNRILNTSILLEGNSETIIPVSCTEQGRWGYTSAAFYDSGTIMSHRIRASKGHTVSDSLRAGRGYSSDQGHVWSEIERMHREAGTSSATGAMRDVYTAKTEELNEYLQTFECVPHQQGSLVFINGEAAGFDVISRESAYESLHPKLLGSYAIDALIQKKERFDKPSADKARELLQQAQMCEESKFDSIGRGHDYRFEGPNVVGSGLVLAGSVIHLAFFRMDENERVDRMSGYMQRRDFRRSRRRDA